MNFVVRDGAPGLAAGGGVQAGDVGEVIAFECRDHQQVGFDLPERRQEQGKRMGLETVHGPGIMADVRSVLRPIETH